MKGASTEKSEGIGEGEGGGEREKVGGERRGIAK